MFRRLGRFVVHHPWKIIVGWVLAAAAVLAFAPGLDEVTTTDQSDFLPDSYGSIAAMRLEEQTFLPEGGRGGDATATVVVVRADGGRLTEVDQALAGQVAQRVRSEVAAVTSAVTGKGAVAANGQVQLVSIRMDGGPEDQRVLDAVGDIRRSVGAVLAGTGLTGSVIGDAAKNLDSQAAFDTAFLIVTVATVILIICMLLLIYRSPIAALLPVAVVALVSVIAPGVITPVMQLLDLEVDPALEILMTIVLYGVGTDYILFLLFRYRERLRAGDEPGQALTTAVHRVGEVITSAAAAIMIAFCVLLLADFGAFTSFGPGLAVAVAIMALAVLTLVPAVVALLGPRVFWPSRSWRHQPGGRVFARLGRLTARRPALVAAGCGGLLVALALGALGMRLDFQQGAGVAEGTESARGTAQLQAGFPVGALAPTTVYLRADGGATITEADAQRCAAALRQVPGVGGLLPGADGRTVRFSPDNRVARVDLLLDDQPGTSGALDLVDGRLRQAAKASAPAGTSVLIGGASAILADIRHANTRDLSVILPVAGLLIAIVLALLLRSMVAPVYLMLAVLLGFFATLGAASMVFQHLVGHTGLSFVLPTFLYLFVVAIGTDYNILMIARLREEVRRGMPPRQAAAAAIEHGGPSIAAAGSLLAGTFASMMLVRVAMLRELGFGVSAGIMLAAFLMSMFLVPGVTALLGRMAWIPGRPGQHRAAREPAAVTDAQVGDGTAGTQQVGAGPDLAGTRSVG